MRGLYDPDKRDIKKIKQEREVMFNIQKYFSKHSHPPTYRELMKMCSCFNSTSTVKATLERLKDKGLIDFKPRIPRSLKIIKM
jgi:repressor LexA